MAHQVSASQPTEPFEYVLFEEDIEQQKTVISTSNQISPWIDPNVLKLTHRIGRGPFGDVWIATHYLSTEDYHQRHEVAVKMLHPVKEDEMQTLLSRFDEMFLKCQGLQGVCFLHGISRKNGNVCIAMKFYEGSVGDQMSRHKGGKLSVVDVLRYGVDLARGILELHKRGILVLNLKPYNFLLDEHDQAILGDFGIPSLLLGISSPSTDLMQRLGTPSYMAPEQWESDVRGPISFETDSWGFGCSVVEMLSGIQPWCGRSADEIYHLVVTKQEKPMIPEGLPTAVENVLHGCFEYDLRNRPLMEDILHAFERCKNTVSDTSGWSDLGNKMAYKSTRSSYTDWSLLKDHLHWSDLGNKMAYKSTRSGYTDWSLLKDHLQVGDTVRSRKPKNICKLENMEVSEGTVVGLESNADESAYVLVRVHGIHDPLRVPSYTLERVTCGFAAGDWVRMLKADENHSPVGILHSIERNGRVTAGFIGMETLWRGNCSELQMAESYCVGQFVRVKANISSPRFEWPLKRTGLWATGRVMQILPNGCLMVGFPGRLSFGDGSGNFLADPAEVEAVSFSMCEGLAEKYEHLEDMHWAVRPLVIVLGLFAAMKLGIFVGKKVGRSRRKVDGQQQQQQQQLDNQNSSNPAWLKNILFREGSTASVAAR